MIAEIDIARDFSPYPGGRLRTDGPASGEEFRDDRLIPALKRSETVDVVLDGAMGLPPSFLEEAFGGLLRRGVPLHIIRSKLRLIARSPKMQRYPDQIWRYIMAAAGE